MIDVADPLRIVTPVAITDAMFVSSTIAETDHSAWSSGTTYAAADRVIRTGTHRIYESLQGSNTNHTPESSPTWWVEVAPTNRWCMFDLASGTLSTAATSIETVIAPGRIDTLALIDADAHTARIEMYTVAEGTFFDQTYTLTGAGDGVEDWYDYFYAAIGSQSVLIVKSLPAIGDAEITVTLTRSGGTVALGALVVGQSTEIGAAKIGARAGIVDYSRKSTDEFGRTSLVQRTYAKTMTLSVWVERARVDAVARKLAALRATVALWLAQSDAAALEALQVFGFFKDWEVTVEYHDLSLLSLTIEGIT